MRFRDRIKGRRQSTNVEIVTKEQGQKLIKKSEMMNEAMSNPRTLIDEPIEYNNDKNNKDRAKGALGSVMRNDPKQHFRRRASVKDPKPGGFEKDAAFFKHTIKDN